MTHCNVNDLNHAFDMFSIADKQSSNNTGVIAAAVIGALAVLIITATVVGLLYLRRR